MTTHDINKSKAPATKTAPVQRTAEQDVAASEAERTAQNIKPQFGGPPSPQQARMMQRMQRTVGNAQVQRMLNSAAVQRQAAPKPQTQTPAVIAPTQRTAETAAPTQEVQRTPTAPITPIATPTHRPSAPISRGVWDTITGAGKSLANKAGQAVQQGAKWAFEKALKAAGVDPKRVMGLINRAGGAVGSIIKNPARFGNTLVNAVRQGFGKFKDNIGTHMQAGFSGWLFGTMSKAGVSIPKDLSPQSVLTLVLQVLNVTPAALKQRVARQAGGQNVERAEQAWGVIGKAMRGGVGGLWTMLSEYLGDLKTVVIGGIKEWVITSVIKAAVMRIASMFNPASAIVAVIKTIYNVVTFLIQRAGQISALFSAVADSASALAQGNTQQAAAKIEQVLARAVPVVIGFLASMVGLNGIAGKVKEIIGRVRSRIDGAIDKMITKVVSRFKGLTGKAGGKQGTGAAASPATPVERNRKVQTGITAIHTQEQKLAGEGGISQKEADSIAQNVKKQHPIFQSISAVDGGKTWDYNYTVARQVEKGTVDKQPERKLSPKKHQKELDILYSPGNSKSGQGSLGGSSTDLCKNLTGKPSVPGYQAHHLIPTELAKKSVLMRAAADAGYDQDAAANGIMLPGSTKNKKVTDEDLINAKAPRHNGSHPDSYLSLVHMLLLEQEGFARKAAKNNDPWTENALLSQVASIQNRLRKKLLSETDALTTYRKRDAFKEKFGKLVGRPGFNEEAYKRTKQLRKAARKSASDFTLGSKN